MAPHRLRRPVLAITSAAVLALGVGLGAPLAANTEVRPPSIDLTRADPGYADLVEAVMPAVVGVRTERAAAANEMAQQSPFGPRGGDMEEFMRRFFGENGPRMPGTPPGGQQGPQIGMGSGFVIDPSGYIVTNNHVVEGADDITVILNEGEEVPGTLIGRDPSTDLALLKVEPANPLPFVNFGNSDAVRVGDRVLAIGSPFGLGSTVTSGIVSARSRDIGSGPYDDFLQIDAAINRGNSGGPTFNLRGEVVGVNTAIFSPSGGSVGIGFAIPASAARDIIADLRDDGRVERGWLGVTIQRVTDELAEGLGLPNAEGALVSNVSPDGPAADAGVERGDVILRFNDEPITQMRELPRVVARVAPGEEGRLAIWRNGQEQTLAVQVGQMPDQDQQVAAAEENRETGPRLGLALAPLSPDARQSLGLGQDARGVLVEDVDPSGPAAEQGIQPGDLIREVAREPVTEPSQVIDAVRAAAERGDKSLLMLLSRDGQDRFVAVRLAAT